MSAPSPNSWLLLMALGLIWGGSFLAIEQALTGLGPLSIAAGRIVLGAIAIGALARFQGVAMPRFASAEGRSIWGHAIAMGLLSNAVPFTLLGWGQQYVTSSFAGITMAGVPLLVLPLAHFLVPGERMRWRRSLGFGFGFLGVIVLIGPGALWFGPPPDAAEGPLALARMACLGAAACYAMGSIVTRRTPKGPLLAFSTIALFAAAAMIVPTALLVEGPPAWPGTRAALAVAYLGLMPTALATIMLVHVINTAGPAFLSLVNYLVPLWAVLLGALLLAEPLQPQTLFALGLILAGMIVAQSRTKPRGQDVAQP